MIGSPGRVAIPLLPVLEDSACRACSQNPQKCFSKFHCNSTVLPHRLLKRFRVMRTATL